LHGAALERRRIWTERVRIWLRDGSYMLHNLSRTGSVTIAGQAVTWAVLEDGDEIRIGVQTLVFRAAAAGPQFKHFSATFLTPLALIRSYYGRTTQPNTFGLRPPKGGELRE
jgi:predicted component of type VI protein secretion system